MRFKLDENLPSVTYFETPSWALVDVDTVIDEGVEGQSDQVVFEAAQATGRFLITQDLDFSDIRRFAPGSHAGILLIRLKNPSRRALLEKLEEIGRFESIDDWSGCFVVATETKIRILRPATPNESGD